MSELGRELVDGRGTERVLQALQSRDITIRQAGSSDCRLLWELANDPAVRAFALSPHPIPWEDHVAWFREKTQGTACQILVGEIKGELVGQVRVDQWSDFEGEIHISVTSEFRGTGTGCRMLELALRHIFATTRLSRIHGYMLPNNLASIRVVEKVGFQKIGEEVVRGSRATFFTRVGHCLRSLERSSDGTSKTG